MAETHSADYDARWGVTWVGGTLLYDSREEAERKRRAFGSGSVIPSPTPGHLAGTNRPEET